MKKLAMFTTVKISCKPLVKAFLENNFGNPVVIPDDHILNRVATAQLNKDNYRNNQFTPYENCIELAISNNNFRYDGFSINEMNTQRFNSAVDNYIKTFYRSNLDSLLISQEKQTKWKERFLELTQLFKNTSHKSAELQKELKKMHSELEEHEINIKEAIEIVLTRLKLTFEDLAYETIKKDYYRYRMRKQAEIN